MVANAVTIAPPAAAFLFTRRPNPVYMNRTIGSHRANLAVKTLYVMGFGPNVANVHHLQLLRMLTRTNFQDDESFRNAQDIMFGFVFPVLFAILAIYADLDNCAIRWGNLTECDVGRCMEYMMDKAKACGIWSLDAFNDAMQTNPTDAHMKKIIRGVYLPIVQQFALLGTVGPLPRTRLYVQAGEMLTIGQEDPSKGNYRQWTQNNNLANLN